METVKKYSRHEVGQLVARYYRGETDGSEVHALALGLQKETPGLSYASALSQIMAKSDAPDDHRVSEARKKMNELLSLNKVMCLDSRAACTVTVRSSVRH